MKTRGPQWPVISAMLGLLFLVTCYRPAPLDSEALIREILDRGTQPGVSPDGRAAPGPTFLVTEEDAAVLASSGSGAVRVEQARAMVVRADVNRAKRIDNPELRVSNGWEEDESFGQDVVQVSLRWSPTSLFRHMAEVDLARALVPVADAETAVVAWQARRDARRAWNEAALEAARVVLEQQRTAIRQEDRDRLAAAPGADPVIVARAAMALAEAEDEVRDRRRRELEALGELARILGLGDASSLRVPVTDGNISCPAPLIPDRSLVAGAARKHPNVRVRLAEYEAAEAGLKLEYSRRIPWFRFVQIGWGFEGRNDRHRLRLGLGVDLPILDWNQGGIEAGKARRDREAAQVRDEMFRVTASLDDALRRWADARARMDRLEEVLLPAAQDAVRITGEAVESGRLSSLDLSRVRLDALELRERHVQAALECRLAAVDAEYAAGAPLADR